MGLGDGTSRTHVYPVLTCDGIDWLDIQASSIQYLGHEAILRASRGYVSKKAGSGIHEAFMQQNFRRCLSHVYTGVLRYRE